MQAMQQAVSSFSMRTLFKLGLVATLLVLAVLAIPNCVEWLDAKHVMVIQYPNGTLSTFTEPGPKPQWFGTVTKYERRAQYSFTNNAKFCNNVDSRGYPPQSIRFSEGGHATLCGALSWEMPVVPKYLLQIQKDFSSQYAVEQQLVAQALTNAIYFSGQMMTSTESAAERRAEMLHFIEDQMKNGVYQTQTRPEKQKDPITGVDRVVNVVELVKEKDGTVRRTARSAIADYGITLVQTTIGEIKYEPAVEDQIKQQQKAKTEVQIAIANAKKAEQDALTIAKQGEATAAKAKWDQETIKARVVTEAQQRLEIAVLDKQAAEQEKQRQILLGQGESERRKLVMSADGALTQKLEAYTKVSQMYAEAIQKHQGAWVPTVIMGNGNAAGQNQAMTLIELLTAKTARDLGLDLAVKK